MHDTLEEHCSEVLVADAHNVKGLAPLARKTDPIDARAGRVVVARLVSAIWLPDPAIRSDVSRRAFGCDSCATARR